MFVEQLRSKARERLITIADDAPLIQAAALLRSGSDLVIVCNSAGFLAGVITKTDIVSQISHCQGASCITAVALVMNERGCALPANQLSARRLGTNERARPEKRPGRRPRVRPLGLLHARDILQGLLNKSEYEEALLRDYVMGLGYH